MFSNRIKRSWNKLAAPSRGAGRRRRTVTTTQDAAIEMLEAKKLLSATTGEEASTAEIATQIDLPQQLDSGFVIKHWQDASTPSGEQVDHARMLDEYHEFFLTGTTHHNWGGKGEKWFRGGEDKAWHFITPDGNIYRWTTPGKAEGDLVAQVDSYFHKHLGDLTTMGRQTHWEGRVDELSNGDRFEFTSETTGQLIRSDGSVTE